MNPINPLMGSTDSTLDVQKNESKKAKKLNTNPFGD